MLQCGKLGRLLLLLVLLGAASPGSCVAVGAFQAAAVDSASLTHSREATKAARQKKNKFWPFDSSDDDAAVDAAQDTLAPLGNSAALDGVPADAAEDLAGDDEALPPTAPPSDAGRRLPRRQHRLSALASKRARAMAARASLRQLLIPDALPVVRQGARQRPPPEESAAAPPSAEYDLVEPGSAAAEGPTSDVQLLRQPPPQAQRRPQQSLVARGRLQQQRFARLRRSSPDDSPEGSPAPQDKGQQMAQCLKFAAWAKAQQLKGEELVQTWKGTCLPAVQVGMANRKYAIMCEALGQAVQDFSSKPDWAPEAACKVVVKVFRESGIGMSPVSP